LSWENAYDPSAPVTNSPAAMSGSKVDHTADGVPPTTRWSTSNVNERPMTAAASIAARGPSSKPW
jgi:hypothetical protein